MILIQSYLVLGLGSGPGQGPDPGPGTGPDPDQEIRFSKNLIFSRCKSHHLAILINI